MKSIEQLLDVLVPDPLDPHLANVSIRSGSNHPGDHFDIHLSATFGTEYVDVEVGDEKIEIKVEIYRAEVIFSTKNCVLHLIDSGGDHGEAWELVDETRTVQNHSRGKGAEIKVQASTSLASLGSLDGELTHHSGKERKEQATGTRRQMPWRLVSPNVVQIGYLEPNKILEGKIVDEKIAVRATPTDLDSPIAILARLRVREKWVKMSGPKPVSKSGKVVSYLKRLTSQVDPESRSQELFSMLIQKLVIKKLQSERETRDATLAAAAIVFVPSEMRMLGAPTSSGNLRVSIDPAVVEDFIKSSDADQEKMIELLDRDEPFRDEWERVFSSIPSAPVLSLYLPVETYLEEISKAWAMSVGIKVNARYDQDAKTLTLRFLDKRKPPMAASEMMRNADHFRRDLMIYSGAIAKGEYAFKIAQAFGFEFGYGTFQKRIKDYVIRSGWGNLVSVCDLLAAIGQSHRLDDLVGRSINISIDQFVSAWDPFVEDEG